LRARPAISPWTGIAAYLAAAPVLLLLLLLMNALSGCATYTAKFEELKPQMADGEFEAALATVEKEAGDKERVLYHLERGLIFHYADRWDESNLEFAMAEVLAADMYDQSLSEGAISLLTNDTAISYRPRPFEMAMVPYYRALNYIYLGQRSEALVEARRASQSQARFVDATLDGLREQDRGDFEQIRNNAFLLYFAGMLYDWDGEVNDAFIAYRNAAVAYQQNHVLLQENIPPALGRDIARTALRLGFRNELDQVYESCPDVFAGAFDDSTGDSAEFEQSAGWRGGQGEVVMLLETGFVPAKSQVRFDVPIFSGEDYDNPGYWSWYVVDGMGGGYAYTGGGKIEYWVSVAAPKLDDLTTGSVHGAWVTAASLETEARSARVANLARQARVTFDAEKPTIFFKTILRGLTKYLASKGAEKAAGEWAGLVANIFGAVTETADTRSWLTLPEHLHIVRLTLPPGIHDLDVEVLGHQGEVLFTRQVTGVEVRAGDWSILSRRLF
jgi:hypothetical protein